MFKLFYKKTWMNKTWTCRFGGILCVFLKSVIGACFGGHFATMNTMLYPLKCYTYALYFGIPGVVVGWDLQYMGCPDACSKNIRIPDFFALKPCRVVLYFENFGPENVVATNRRIVEGMFFEITNEDEGY
ncbi:uncharacterized protein EV154DRAFT_479772 [Mucor mucedo]|uniref:uncharacterized protein n=1 Tax=Mucor mucedo TaxID=29922 RepID=UPI002220525C|nr:uncharacterized protein EV154DRAFT_479772 [Mucor mucedo]KAI7893102.1 hypothetical protein EV154DRAFT_479772 [Mucor mucedo]